MRSEAEGIDVRSEAEGIDVRSDFERSADWIDARSDIDWSQISPLMPHRVAPFAARRCVATMATSTRLE